jgi:hypothetical protein
MMTMPCRHIILCSALALCAAVIIAPAAAETIDGSKPMLCALYNVTSCVPDEGCQSETPDSANVPRFLHVSVGDQTIRGARADGEQRVTPIKSVEHLDNRLVLQGVDDPLAWSIAITANGDMALTGMKGDVGFIAFGACTIP